MSPWEQFSQLLDVHRFSDDRKMEINTAEPLVPEFSPLEAKISVAKLNFINRQGLIKFRQN
jgi:hypothetical protein